MKFAFLLSILFLSISCTKTNKTDGSGNDSTAIIKDSLSSGDSIAVVDPVTSDKLDYNADYYLVQLKLDTTEFQLINKTCAILIEETSAQTEARKVLEEIEYKERTAREEKARKEWESHPHDSGEYFESENRYTGDGDFYNMQASDFLKELEIPVIVAKPKPYIRLVNKSKKEWTLDIRTNMQPNWSIILFNANKEPVVLEAMDVNKDRLIQYFLLN